MGTLKSVELIVVELCTYFWGDSPIKWNCYDVSLESIICVTYFPDKLFICGTDGQFRLEFCNVRTCVVTVTAGVFRYQN